MKRGRGLSASPTQRLKVKGERCLNCRQEPCDPAHIVARAQGGCDHELCVVPLCRRCHDRYDAGALDLLPLVVRHRVPEVMHAVEHMGGDLLGLLHRLCGERFVPESLKEAA